MDRYTTRTLANGATAVLDAEDRNRVVLIGTQAEADDYLGAYDAYLAEAEWDAQCERDYATSREATATHGSWFGRDEF